MKSFNEHLLGRASQIESDLELTQAYITEVQYNIVIKYPLTNRMQHLFPKHFRTCSIPMPMAPMQDESHHDVCQGATLETLKLIDVRVK